MQFSKKIIMYAIKNGNTRLTKLPDRNEGAIDIVIARNKIHVEGFPLPNTDSTDYQNYVASHPEEIADFLLAHFQPMTNPFEN